MTNECLHRTDHGEKHIYFFLFFIMGTYDVSHLWLIIFHQGLLNEWTSKSPAVEDLNSKGSSLCSLITSLTSPAKTKTPNKSGKHQHPQRTGSLGIVCILEFCVITNNSRSWKETVCVFFTQALSYVFASALTNGGGPASHSYLTHKGKQVRVRMFVVAAVSR